MEKSNKNPFFGTEGKFVEEKLYIEYIKYEKTGAQIFEIGNLKFKIFETIVDRKSGWGWEVYRNGSLWHRWEKGDYDDKGNLTCDMVLCKSRKAALRKCLLGSIRSTKEDLQKLNWVLKGLK